MKRTVVGIMLWSSLWRTGKELHLLIVISHWDLINRSIQGFWLDRFIHLYYWQMDLKILQYWSHEVIFFWKTEYSQDRNRYIVPWVIGVQNCNGVASWSNSGPLMWNIFQNNLIICITYKLISAVQWCLGWSTSLYLREKNWRHWEKPLVVPGYRTLISLHANINCFISL